MDLSDELVIRIRALQEMHSRAHQALLNWSRWSRDRRGIFPAISKPHIWQEYKQSEADDWGEDHAVSNERLAQDDRKTERPEDEAYDEKAAQTLDERIHSPMAPLYLKQLLRTAYITRDVPEYQFPRACGCPPHAFTERLENALIFVGRFA